MQRRTGRTKRGLAPSGNRSSAINEAESEQDVTPEKKERSEYRVSFLLEPGEVRVEQAGNCASAVRRDDDPRAEDEERILAADGRPVRVDRAAEILAEARTRLLKRERGRRIWVLRERAGTLERRALLAGDDSHFRRGPERELAVAAALRRAVGEAVAAENVARLIDEQVLIVGGVRTQGKRPERCPYGLRYARDHEPATVRRTV